jgi:hypothetical protein
MLRTLDIVMIGALIAGAGWTFKVKHDAEQAVARVETLETRIRLEREAIEILKADWSLLTSPERLEALIERYKDELMLDHAQPRQIVTFDKIPEKPPEILPPLDGSVDGDGEAGGSSRADAQTDPDAVTGSVAKPVEDPAPAPQEDLGAMEEIQ